MTTRNLFAELTEGFDALAAARKGKKTLRATEVDLKLAAKVSEDELRAIRENINMTACMKARRNLENIQRELLIKKVCCILSAF